MTPDSGLKLLVVKYRRRRFGIKLNGSGRGSAQRRRRPWERYLGGNGRARSLARVEMPMAPGGSATGRPVLAVAYGPHVRPRPAPPAGDAGPTPRPRVGGLRHGPGVPAGPRIPDRAPPPMQELHIQG